MKFDNKQLEMQGIKNIGGSYKMVRGLFQIHSYLYAQVCSLKNNYQVHTAALYLYENEDPSQCLRMLRQKLDIEEQGDPDYVIFPHSHVKQSLLDKNISLFFISDYILPLRNCNLKRFETLDFLQILHGGLSSLNQLHNRDIIHGNITLSTCYLVRNKTEGHCRFSLNILDTNYFTQEDCSESIEDRLFQSEGQSLGQSVSFKDDLQSLVYVLSHLIAKGKMFTVQRFQLEWTTETEFLRWKTCEFFKEMILRIPSELQILIEIYTIAKSLRRNQKPDYLKLIKKVLSVMAVEQVKKTKKTGVMTDNSIKTSQNKERTQPIRNKESVDMKQVSEEEIYVKMGSLKAKRGQKDVIKEVQFNV